MIASLPRSWTAGKSLRLCLEDRGDFAAFYQVHFEQCYAPLHLERGDFVLDAGAHIGTWTVLASSKVGPGGRVVAVEANPDSYRKLRKNIELNGLTNVDTVCSALWSTDQDQVRLEGDGVMTRVDPRGTQIASTVRIDTLAAEYGTFKAAKIDIEGSEVVALEGAPETLRTCRELILEADSEDDFHRILAVLAGCGFSIETLPWDNVPKALSAATRHPLLFLGTEWGNHFRTTRDVMKRMLVHDPTYSLRAVHGHVYARRPAAESTVQGDSSRRNAEVHSR